MFYVDIDLLDTKIERSVYAKAINVLKDNEMTFDDRIKFIRDTLHYPKSMIEDSNDHCKNQEFLKLFPITQIVWCKPCNV